LQFSPAIMFARACSGQRTLTLKSRPLIWVQVSATEEYTFCARAACTSALEHLLHRLSAQLQTLVQSAKGGNIDYHPAKLISQWTEMRGEAMHARTNAHPPLRDSPVVILVHGMVISSRWYMEPAAARIAPLCRTYAVDLPGYGKSYKPLHILNIPQLADVLTEWMERQEYRRPSGG
jgi:pimeloyl-ACP methyl ester carboxylesterase